MDDPQNAGKCRREIVRKIYFTSREWIVIASRMHAIGQKNFSRFAREVLIKSEVKISNSRAVSDELNRQLSRIGNNFNQLARQANTNHVATRKMVEESFALLLELRAIVKEFKTDGCCQSHPNTLNAQSSD